MDSSTASAVLQVVFQAKDEATAKIQGLQKQLEQVNKGAGIVKDSFLVAGTAIVAFGAYSAKTAADFQQQMNLIQTQAGASAKEVKTMSKAVLDMASSVGTGPKELATGLYHIESAGFRGAQALNMLKAAAEGAKTGNANLEDVTQAMISLTASRIKGVKDETDAMAILNATVGSGDMKMEGLAQAMSTGIMPAAAAFGLSVKDVGAALATITDNAVPPIDAATRLRMSFTMMGAPSDAAAKAMRGIGLSSTQMADDMRSGGLLKALEDFNKHLKAVPPVTEGVVKGTKMTAKQIDDLKNKITYTQREIKIYGEEHVKAGVHTDQHNLKVDKATHAVSEYQKKLAGANAMMVKTGGQALTLSQQQEVVARAFGGGREAATILTLLGQMDRLKSKYSAISEGQKNFADDWKKTQENVNFQMQQLGATVQVLAIKFGNVLLPAVNNFLTFVNGSLLPAIGKVNQFFSTHKDALIAVATVLGGVLTTAVIAFGITLQATLMAALPGLIAFTVAFWPFILIGAAIAGVATLIVLHFNDIRNVVMRVGQVFRTVYGLLQQFFSGGDVTLKKGQEGYIGFVRVLDTLHEFFQIQFDAMAKIIQVFVAVIQADFVAPLLLEFNIIKFAFIVLWDLFAGGIEALRELMGAFGAWFWGTFGTQITAVFNLIKAGVLLLVQAWMEQWTMARAVFMAVWNAISGFVTPIVSGMVSFISAQLALLHASATTQLKKLNDAWVNFWGGVKSFAIGVTNDITNAVKNMLNGMISFFDNIIHGTNTVGKKVPGYINIPDIPHFQDGGWVPNTGLAVLHKGEFVMSNAMLKGTQNTPSSVANTTNNKQNVNVYATINSPMDIDMLGYKLAFAVRNAR